MNERIKQLAEQALQLVADEHTNGDESRLNTDSYHVKNLIQEKFAELIVRDMHRKVIASILITDVVMEEKGQVPTSEDYIRAINKDFGVSDASLCKHKN